MMARNGQTVTKQIDIIVRHGQNQDELVAKEGEEFAPHGTVLVDARIVAGFPVGSWWEGDKGIVVEFTYL